MADTKPYIINQALNELDKATKSLHILSVEVCTQTKFDGRLMAQVELAADRARICVDLIQKACEFCQNLHKNDDRVKSVLKKDYVSW